MKKFDDKIIKYFDEQLSVDERKEFERELEIDTELRNAFESYRKVNELFSNEDEILVNQNYFNSIISRFRQKLEKEIYFSPLKKISFAFTATLIIISSYLFFQYIFFNQNATHYSIQSFTDNLSEKEMDELADYISADYWNPISADENLLILDEADFSIEGVVSNISEDEGLMILSDYDITDIYLFADEKDIELAYNEILTKRIY